MGRVGTTGLRKFKGFNAAMQEYKKEQNRKFNAEPLQCGTEAQLWTLCSESNVRLTLRVNPPTDPLAEMEEFPDEISSLSHLQQLDLLSLSKLNRLPASLVCLQYLLLQECRQLRDLSSSLGQLKTLQSLELIETGIDTDDSSFMNALTSMSCLERLYLCTSSFTWPVATAGSLSALRTLQLEGYGADHNVVNLIRAAAASITALYMKEVTADNSELAEAVCTQTELETLVLEAVLLPTPFLPEISRLVNLRCLSLVKCTTLEQLPESIGALTNLEEVNLKGTKVSELPETISSLPRLAALHLGECELLVQLPASIGRLSSLRSLHLSACRGLRHLGQTFEGLSQLQELFLDHCPLPSNPLELCSFTALQLLTLPCARQLPKSLYQLTYRPQHLPSLLAFLGDLRQGQVVCKLQKIVVLGPEMAGKSSLLDSLIGGKASTRDANERTVGIDIRRWFADTDADRVVNAFDAGGQRVYQATHGIFLGDSDLMLCVSRGAPGDATKEQVLEAADKLLEWMDGAQQHVARARVLVAFTHLDVGEEGADPGRRFRRVLWALRHRLKQNAAALDKAMRRREEEVRNKIGEELAEDELEHRDESLVKLDKLMLEGVTPLSLKGLSDLIPILERAGCAGLDLAYCCLGSVVEDGLERARKIAALMEDVEAIHERMQASLQQRLPAGDPLLASVRQAQSARARQPLVLGSVAVSSKTNAGMPYLLHCLREATKDEVLFPQKPQPTAFAVLERIFREGRQKVTSATEGPGSAPGTQLTGWERSLASEADQTKYNALRTLCAEPLIRRKDLAKAVHECGMGDAAWLHRALQFLHDAGSALSFARKGGLLASRVFTQPQWIVDAMKYVVRDPVQSNSELRDLDSDVEGMEQFSDELARFRGIGELDHGLLKCFWQHPKYQPPHPLAGWRKFEDDHIETLIDLMKGFRLLVPIIGRKRTTYLVPAMMQSCELQPGMTEPEWWLPRDSHHADHMMRRVFRASRRLPLGLWPAMQVSISLKTANSDEYPGTNPPEHASNASWLEREEADGAATETVVVTMLELENCVEFRVLGYMKMRHPDVSEVRWELFKLVTGEIQSVAADRPGVLLEEFVPIVASGHLKLTRYLESSSRPSAKLPEPVPLQTPQASSPQRSLYLQSPPRSPVPPSPARSQAPMSSASSENAKCPRPRILIFCARKHFDTDIDTEGETAKIQKKTRHQFDKAVVCPRVSFKTFRDGMEDVRRDKITIVHFTGHGQDDEGLFFVKDDCALQYVTIDPDMLAEFLQDVHEVVECVFLNACSTDRTGMLLREHNVRNVVCWQNEVRDEAAAQFSKEFYKTLDTVTREHGYIPDQSYCDAFRLARRGLIHWLTKGKGQHLLDSAPADKGQPGPTQTSEGRLVKFIPVFLSQRENLDEPLQVKPRNATRASTNLTQAAAAPRASHQHCDLHQVVQTTPFDSARNLPRGPPASAPEAPRALVLQGFFGVSCAVFGYFVRHSWKTLQGAAAVLARLARTARARGWGWVCVLVGLTAAALLAMLGRVRITIAWVPRRADGSPTREDENQEPPVDLIPADISANTRMVTNKQGELELEAFQALGVRLTYKNWNLSDTRRKYWDRQLDVRELEERGVALTKCNGKDHLKLTTNFLRTVFQARQLPGKPEIRDYTDVFGYDGVLVQWVEAKRPSLTTLEYALDKLREALRLRKESKKHFDSRSKGTPDEGHEYMILMLGACVERLEIILKDREHQYQQPQSSLAPVLAAVPQTSAWGKPSRV